MFETLFAMRGRVNFTNLARYSSYNESTFRRRFGQNFDWLSLNNVIMGSFSEPNEQIAAIDCSFIPKNGDSTFGLDHYWSGSTSHTEKGLEISALAIIEVSSGRAWSLDVVQTPAHLNRVDDLPLDNIKADKVSEDVQTVKQLMDFVQKKHTFSNKNYQKQALTLEVNIQPFQKHYRAEEEYEEKNYEHFDIIKEYRVSVEKDKNGIPKPPIKQLKKSMVVLHSTFDIWNNYIQLLDYQNFMIRVR